MNDDNSSLYAELTEYFVCWTRIERIDTDFFIKDNLDNRGQILVLDVLSVLFFNKIKPVKQIKRFLFWMFCLSTPVIIY